MLVDLHQYLLEQKFDYLRTNPAGDRSTWQGTDANGQIVKTSESWSMIEKAIELQMAHNIEKGCRFTYRVARDRAKELSMHRFFGVKHNLVEDAAVMQEPQSPSVIAFEGKDTDTFDKRYESLFSSY